MSRTLAADSATIRVDWSGGGDTILIAPGTYTGEDNRNLTLGPSKDLVIENDPSEIWYPLVDAIRTCAWRCDCA